MRPVIASAILLLSLTARAAIYETVVNADDEDDVFNMYQRGDISTETADTLLELIREGVDLNSGSRERLYDLPGLTYADVDRIIAYRTQKGRIEDPAELVGAEAITAEQLIQIAPFIRLDAAQPKWPVSGKVRAVSQYTAGDTVAPPAMLSGTFKGPWDLSAGFMAMTSRRIPAPVKYDPVLDALVTDGFRYMPHLPRFFLQWQNSNRKVIVGTFTLGFAERLTLDNTRRLTPKGIYLTNDFRRPIDLTRTCRVSGDPIVGECEGGETNRYITADYDWREVFRGIAASLENLDLGDQRSLSMYGFLSFQNRSLYQYELFDRRYCDDPNSTDESCKSPTVFFNAGANTGASRLTFSTLPYLFNELAGGGHVDFKPNYRFRFGLTGYAAAPLFDVVAPGTAAPFNGFPQLDFQEWSRYPNGGPFGAIGLDGQAVWNELNFHLEVARSFDRSVGNQGGGFAALQRTTWAPKGHEVELSFRYYDNHFLNPYARPFSGPDEESGQRARNELGARLRYFGRWSRDWEFKSRLDFWMLPFDSPRIGPAGMTNLFAVARLDFTGWKFFEPAVWVDMRNRNLASSTHGKCAPGTIVIPIRVNSTEGGDILLNPDQPFDCSGDFYRVAERLEFRPLPNRLLTIIQQGWLTWKDDIRYKDRFRLDVQTWVEVRSEPVDWLDLRLRSRYLFQDVSDNTYLEQSLWTTAEAVWTPRKGTRLGFRYDLYVWLDRRRTTWNELDGVPARSPFPEHRLLVDLRANFP